MKTGSKWHKYSIAAVCVLLLLAITGCLGDSKSKEEPAPNKEPTANINEKGANTVKNTEQTKPASDFVIHVNQVLSDVSSNPVGLCMSWLLDSDKGRPGRSRTTEQAVKALNAGYLRFPMGALADNYLWDTPPFGGVLVPKAASMHKAPGTWDWAVNKDGTFKAGMDFDEFMSLVQKTGARAIVTVNALAWEYKDGPSRQTIIESARQWVKYAKDKGYHVAYWQIGNEVDHHRDVISTEEFISLYTEMYDAMKQEDPDAKIGPGLLNANAMFNEFIHTLPDKIDHISVHQYQNQFQSYSQWRDDAATDPTPKVTAAIKKLAAIDEADHQRIKLIVTEFSSHTTAKNAWKSKENNLLKSLVTFDMLGDMLTKGVSATGFWISHNPWNFDGTKYSDGSKYSDADAIDLNNNILPQGKALQVMAQYLNREMVAAAGDNAKVKPYASYSPDSMRLTVYLLNKNDEPSSVRVRLDDYKGSTKNEKWVYKGKTAGPDAVNVFWGPEGSVNAANGAFEADLDPLSITVVVFQAKQ